MFMCNKNYQQKLKEQFLIHRNFFIYDGNKFILLLPKVVCNVRGLRHFIPCGIFGLEDIMTFKIIYENSL